jgi:hypothetical protein
LGLLDQDKQKHTLNNVEAAAGLTLAVLVGVHGGITLNKDHGTARNIELVKCLQTDAVYYSRHKARNTAEGVLQGKRTLWATP